MRLLIAEDLRNPQGSTFCFHCGLRSLTHSLISVIPPNLMRTGKKSHLSYYSLGLSHPILYRSGGDSEAKYCLACFTLPDEEDERQGAVSKDGGGQGAESRPGCRQRVRTDPERVEVVLIILSQLPTRVVGSRPGPAGHSSLSGIA